VTDVKKVWPKVVPFPNDKTAKGWIYEWRDEFPLLEIADN
jgi:hypothetical protein